MPPPLFPGAEGLGVRRLTIAVVACLFAIWAGVTLAGSPYLVFAGMAGLLYVGTLAVNAKALAWLVIALQPAALIVPFFPGRPFWWELCALLAWPSLLVYFLVNRQKLTDLKFDRLERGALLALAGYVGVLVVLMFYRGVGFRALGGGQMGGRVYVQQVVLAIVPLLMVAVRLSPKKFYMAMVVGWCMALTYLLSELFFTAGGGTMQKILYFIELPVDGIGFETGYAMTGLRRYASFMAIASSGLACLWTLAPLRDLFGQGIFLAGPAMAGLLFLGLASGSRIMIVLPVAAFFFLTVFQRFWTVGRVMAVIVILSVAVGSLYMTADRLPLSVQRSISLFPGIDVSQVAKDDAFTTNQDRLDVFKRAVDDIPRYCLAGRGFGMDRLDKAPLDSVNSGVAMLYAKGMFYNGIFGALIKTGLPGLFCTLSFVWLVSRLALEVVRLVRLRRIEEQDRFDRLCLVLCAQWFAMVVSFYFTIGDVNAWMQFFGFPAGLIMLSRRLLLERVASENSTTEPVAG